MNMTIHNFIADVEQGLDNGWARLYEMEMALAFSQPGTYLFFTRDDPSTGETVNLAFRCSAREIELTFVGSSAPTNAAARRFIAHGFVSRYIVPAARTHGISLFAGPYMPEPGFVLSDVA